MSRSRVSLNNEKYITFNGIPKTGKCILDRSVTLSMQTSNLLFVLKG